MKTIKTGRLLIILNILVILISAISCSKNRNNIKNSVNIKNAEMNTQKTKEKEYEKLKEILKKRELEGAGLGEDEEFTTDGQLHEEKFLNREYMYTNTADSFKIEKDDKGYFVTEYIDESPTLAREVPVKVEKSRLKLYAGVYLVDEDGFVYAYDTRLKNIVFLNTNLRIMFEAVKVEE